ncbi:MAG: Asp-tRNA(Asn)/Glu-tRNA(Gln) amidotransferase subunit GatB [Defluviitaleaceae bacterium]|nr:Asp-tRNA(Asn)/Glu-tRNA(Gln) amidotransferase subunit GatB [Defluviitaleaceae bacterium]
MKWETVMGLEVHAELSTRSKIFCGCSTLFGAEPNTRVCPVCSGMPGTLPILNKTVVEYAMRLGLALDCTIAPRSKFDRKNYFYPDLPKAYQISQLYSPICTMGKIEIHPEGEESKIITIKEIHMEEDAGKLIHEGDSTFIDYNRSGIPLLEIVTAPDFRTAAQVVAYLEKLREILLYLNICDCKMQEGSLRVDINISVRSVGKPLGTRTEIKNLNSFKAVVRAIGSEQKRQIGLLENNKQVAQETRRWDDAGNTSFAMRSKENTQEYRYFPDPDLPPVSISKAWLKEIEQTLPELAHQKRFRFEKDFGISPKDAKTITSHVNICNLFETLAKESKQTTESANLVIGDIMRLLKATNTLPENLKIDPDKLVFLIKLVVDKKINRSAYREAVEEVFKTDCNPQLYIEKNSLSMIGDDSTIKAVVTEVTTTNPKIVQDYKNGKEKALDSLIGQCMKKMKGCGNPEIIRENLMQAIFEETKS